MRLPRVRFTMRRMMVTVAVLALGLVGFRSVWQEWQEREHHRARIAIRQRLLDAIGDGNNAVLESDPTPYLPPLTDEERRGPMERASPKWRKILKEREAKSAVLPSSQAGRAGR
jgi:hypothetical protein